VSVICAVVIYNIEPILPTDTQFGWKVLAHHLVSIVFATAGLALLWELAVKRIFLDEILEKARISQELKFSGIVQITDSFHRDVDWTSYILNSEKIDIFFSYGQTWRNTHAQELRRFCEKEGTRLQVVLPDPDDQQTLHELARRYSYTEDRLKDLVVEAKDFFETLSSDQKVAIWYLPKAPVFSFYRFDRIGVVAFYTHRNERVAVPTIVCEDGGSLYDYIRKEFREMIRESGLARKVK
jgi:hypothetical protein